MRATTQEIRKCSRTISQHPVPRPASRRTWVWPSSSPRSGSTRPRRLGARSSQGNAHRPSVHPVLEAGDSRSQAATFNNLELAKHIGTYPVLRKLTLRAGRPSKLPGSNCVWVVSTLLYRCLVVIWPSKFRLFLQALGRREQGPGNGPW